MLQSYFVLKPVYFLSLSHLPCNGIKNLFFTLNHLNAFFQLPKLVKCTFVLRFLHHHLKYQQLENDLLLFFTKMSFINATIYVIILSIYMPLHCLYNITHASIHSLQIRSWTCCSFSNHGSCTSVPYPTLGLRKSSGKFFRSLMLNHMYA